VRAGAPVGGGCPKGTGVRQGSRGLRHTAGKPSVQQAAAGLTGRTSGRQGGLNKAGAHLNAVANGEGGNRVRDRPRRQALLHRRGVGAQRVVCLAALHLHVRRAERGRGRWSREAASPARAKWRQSNVAPPHRLLTSGMSAQVAPTREGSAQ
jgi:hypothetical protein